MRPAPSAVRLGRGGGLRRPLSERFTAPALPVTRPQRRLPLSGVQDRGDGRRPASEGLSGPCHAAWAGSRVGF